MNRFVLAACAVLAPTLAAAQTSIPPQQPPAGVTPPSSAGAGAGAQTGFIGVAPAPVSGMSTNGTQPGGMAVTRVPVEGAQFQGQPQGAAQQQPPQPQYFDHSTVNQQQIDAYNQIMRSQMPMTPEMIRRSIALYDEVQRAMLERSEPEIISDSGVMTLEPGEAPPTIYLSANIASIVGFYDSTGQPWPIKQYVMGSGGQFQVIPLGDGANSITVTPLVPVGFTNLVLTLEGEPKPVTVNLKVSQTVVHQRRDIQIMKEGPNAIQIAGDTAAPDAILAGRRGPDGTPIRAEAGNKFLMTAVSGVDMPDSAVPVTVSGVRATAWAIGDSIIIRTRYPLSAPQPLNFLAGPDGVMVYEIKSTPTALFDVGGSMVRADIDIP